jgi:hypothetical protein
VEKYTSQSVEPERVNKRDAKYAEKVQEQEKRLPDFELQKGNRSQQTDDR